METYISTKKESSYFEDWTGKIKTSIKNIAGEYLYIGFLLSEIKEFEYYLDGGYDNVYDYAFVELGFKTTTVKNFINIYERFCYRIQHDSKPKYTLMMEYSKFSYSQLCEMLSLTDLQIKHIEPTATIKEIREIKKELKSQTSDPILDSTEDLSFEVIKEIPTNTNITSYHSDIDNLKKLNILKSSFDNLESLFQQEKIEIIYFNYTIIYK